MSNWENPSGLFNHLVVLMISFAFVDARQCSSLCFFCNEGKKENVCLCVAAAASAESRWCWESLPTFHYRCATGGSSHHSLKAVFAGRRVIWNQQQGVRKTLLACVKRDAGNKLKAGGWVFDINGLSFSWRAIGHGGRPLPVALGGGAAELLWRSGKGLEGRGAAAVTRQRLSPAAVCWVPPGDPMRTSERLFRASSGINSEKKKNKGRKPIELQQQRMKWHRREL